ncbi:MAG: flagellar hook-length control protein FliK [Hyphomonadaceae bacterium]
MDFAAEPVMDAFAPSRAMARPSARTDADRGETFEQHLATVNETATNQISQSTAAPAPGTDCGLTVCERAPQSEGAAEADPTALVAAIPALVEAAAPALAAPPAIAPVATAAPVQIASPSPKPQQQLMQQQAALAAAPVPPVSTPSASQPLQILAPTPATAEKPTMAKSGAPDQSAPAPATIQPGSPAPAPTQPASSAMAAMQPAPPLAAAPTKSIAAPTQPSGGSLSQTQQQPGDATGLSPPQAGQVAAHTPRPDANLARVKQVQDETQSDAQPQATPKVAQAHTKLPTGSSVVNEPAASAPSPAPAADAAQSVQAPPLPPMATQASGHAPYATLDTGAQRASPAAAQVAREIIRRSGGGATSFELRLDPPELGRVEVRMEVSRDHRVTAVIAADSPQALTELARHARELEQQLQSAGLELSENGLSFDLRGGAQGGEARRNEDATPGTRNEENTLERTQTQAARPIGLERWRGVRVDMMV